MSFKAALFVLPLFNINLEPPLVDFLFLQHSNRLEFVQHPIIRQVAILRNMKLACTVVVLFLKLFIPFLPI